MVRGPIILSQRCFLKHIIRYIHINPYLLYNKLGSVTLFEDIPEDDLVGGTAGNGD